MEVNDIFRGKIISIFGGRGTGKSTLCEALVMKSGMNTIYYDPYQEKRVSVLKKSCDSDSIEEILTGKKFYIKTNSHIFLHKMTKVLKNTLFVIDEAGIFYGRKGIEIEGVKEAFIVSRRRGNCILQVFHKFQDNDPNLLNFTNWMFVKKTADSVNYLNYIKRTDQNLSDVIESVWSNYEKNPHYFEFIRYM